MIFWLWIGLAAFSGASAPFIFRSHPFMAALAVSAFPSIALCLIFVRQAVGDGWAALGLAISSIGWSAASLIAAAIVLLVKRANTRSGGL
jgi:hypothetical protein